MARVVREIMNPELLAVGRGFDRDATLRSLLEFGISAAPVVDDDRRPIGVTTLRDLVEDPRSTRISSPARTIGEDASIEEAGRAMVEAGTHHLVVVTGDGRAAGMLSSLDLVRALVGAPAAHPAAFPHRDPDLDVVWSDALAFDSEHVRGAPAEAGVLVLSAGGVQRTESDLWVEATGSLRARLFAMLAHSAERAAALQKLLERRDLRYRHAVLGDAKHRDDIVRRLQQRIDGAPLPRDLAPVTKEGIASR